MEINWQDYAHDELDTATLYEILALRAQVFVVEQQCAYLDPDGQDLLDSHRHIVARHNKKLVACARILAPDNAQHPVKIGRVVVAPEARGIHLGAQLMQQTLRSCQQHWPQHAIFLAAQAHLHAFYSALGFTAVGEIYLEDNIPHIDMQKAADEQ